MIKELTKQLLECQENSRSEEQAYFEDEIKKANELRYQIDVTGQQNRKDNLKIVGVPYSDDEDTSKVVKELAEHLGVEINDEDLSTAHRIHIKEDKEDTT